MTQLEDCYFCGTVGESLASRPVIPPEGDPPEDVQRTVVVCPTCSAKLDRVLDPVVEHFESAAHVEGRPESTSGSGDDGADASESGTVRLGLGSVPTDDEQPADGDGEQPGAAESQAEQEEAAVSPDEGKEATVRDENEGPGDSGDDEQIELPEGTSDIVRLLRNRDFPVEREGIVTAAANAYEIRRGDCQRAIDALIAAGHLRERDGELHPDR